MRNLLCSYREFYAAKSCTKVYVHIYVCNPQIRYIIHMQQQAVWKDNEKRVLRKIILNRNWSCRRFFWVSGGDIFCFSDLSGQILSARSLWRTYSVYLKRRVFFFFQHEDYKHDIVSIPGELIFIAKGHHPFENCPSWLWDADLARPVRHLEVDWKAATFATIQWHQEAAVTWHNMTNRELVPLL